jgi:hypothetical protein
MRPRPQKIKMNLGFRNAVRRFEATLAQARDRSSNSTGDDTMQKIKRRYERDGKTYVSVLPPPPPETAPWWHKLIYGIAKAINPSDCTEGDYMARKAVSDFRRNVNKALAPGLREHRRTQRWMTGQR